ncbi:hypothetical protein [Fusobacterium mortiferum]|uniref:Uncharacterized protein n=1 Tax=Fusobacterium mortiferum TaxID=850 RepID=A0A414Q0T1_FUSMR|nr:hypothetical protein [Fusobacterium mortiferum]RHF64366.1 hypothetical protein DW670_09725 [Fusobacterium mortiferum]RHF74410.1 hypothetical protein DW663_02795 [Fusobacterium mortiferum]
MGIEKAIEILKNNKILDLEKIEYIWLGRLKSVLFANFNIEFNIKDLKYFMSNNEDFIEISSNFFISKVKVKELLRDIPKKEYKDFLENRYVIQIEEEKLSLLTENKRTYEELLRYGLDNSYIDSKWLSDLSIEETSFTDMYEVISDLEKKGIKIK